jgi:hypothetical protein
MVRYKQRVRACYQEVQLQSTESYNSIQEQKKMCNKSHICCSLAQYWLVLVQCERVPCLLFTSISSLGPHQRSIRRAGWDEFC